MNNVVVDLAYSEWHRLSKIAEDNEPVIRSAFTRGIALGNMEHARIPIMGIVAATCRSTAEEFGLVYNPTHPVILHTIDTLVDKFKEAVNTHDARVAVSSIIPATMSSDERTRRLSLADGLDARTALRIEHQRQSAGSNKDALAKVDQERRTAILTRSNMLAITETTRVVNASLEALWLIQEGISKAVPDPRGINATIYGNDITDFTHPPTNARKVIVTRRDDRVCNYCDILDGITARLGASFDTEYGLFDYPPFHPRCRCFIFVTTEVI